MLKTTPKKQAKRGSQNFCQTGVCTRMDRARRARTVFCIGDGDTDILGLQVTLLFSCPQTAQQDCMSLGWSGTTKTPFDFDIKERSQRLVIFETFDQSDEKTRPDSKKPTHLHTYAPTYLCTSIREHPKGDLVCLSVRWYLGPTKLTIKPFTTLPSDPRDL